LPARFEEYAFAMLVADGLGEPGAGSVASRTALSTIAHLALHSGQWHMRIDPRAAAEMIDRAEWLYARADAAVAARKAAGPRVVDTATALTVAYSAGDDLIIAHVGHSRAYVFRDGALIQLTRDQTVAQQRPAADRPPTIEGRAQDLSHILTDAIGGTGSAPTVEVEQFRLLDQDVLLLCTNGLTDVIDNDRIADVLALRRQPEELCALLTEMARQEGGEDNVTVILAQYSVPAS
jgi:protein phosphatase